MKNYPPEFESSHQGDVVPHGLAQRLSNALPPTAKPTRPLASVGKRSAVAFLLLASANFIFGFGFNGGKGWKALDSLQVWSLAAVLMLAMCFLAWDLGARMSPAPRLRWPSALPTVTSAIAVVGWIAAMIPDAGDSPVLYAKCLGLTSLATAAGVFGTWLWIRHGFLPSQTLLTVAGAGALCGFGAVQLFCPLLDLRHVLVSHVPPVILAAWLATTVAGYFSKQ